MSKNTDIPTIENPYMKPGYTGNRGYSNQIPTLLHLILKPELNRIEG